MDQYIASGECFVITQPVRVPANRREASPPVIDDRAWAVGVAWIRAWIAACGRIGASQMRPQQGELSGALNFPGSKRFA